MKIRGNTVGTPISVEKIAERIPGGGAVEPLVVQLDESTGKASHTAGQILEALSSGKFVLASIPGEPIRLSLLSVDATYATFVNFSDDNLLAKFLVTDTGDLECFREYYVTDTTIGDISSALDELHNYAQGLIAGGDSV
jgi:hypothetical protein